MGESRWVFFLKLRMIENVNWMNFISLNQLDFFFFFFFISAASSTSGKRSFKIYY